MSFTKVEADVPPAATANVSAPSVSKSLRRVTEIVATPLESTTALPLSKFPNTSSVLMPERVYGTAVPGATFVVVRVKVAVEPSLTEVLLELSL